MDKTNVAEVALELVDKIQDTRKRRMKSKIVKTPRNNFWVGDIPDCDRYLYYSMINWQDKKMWDEDRQARMDKGKQEEQQIISELIAMGFEVIEGQAYFEIKNRKGEVMARGRIEGKFQVGKFRIPFEIKSMDPRIYSQVNTYEDLDKKCWLRKYKRQTQLYLYGHEQEVGILILTDCLGHWKMIVVYLDYGECEFLIKRMEKTWEEVKKKKIPNRMKFDLESCEMCNFQHICLPDIEGQMAELVDDKDMEKDLQRREELKPLVKEYEKIDNKVKKIYRNSRDVVIGVDWRILVTRKKTMTFKSSLMPKDEKAKYEVESERVTVDVIDLRKLKEEGKNKKEKEK